MGGVGDGVRRGEGGEGGEGREEIGANVYGCRWRFWSWGMRLGRWLGARVSNRLGAGQIGLGLEGRGVERR